MSKGLNARPWCRGALAQQRVRLSRFDAFQRAQDQRRGTVDVQRSVCGQQRDPGLQSTQLFTDDIGQQTQLTQIPQGTYLLQLPVRQFQQRQQACPALERHLINLPLDQHGIEIEASGQVLNVEADLRVVDVENRELIRYPVAVFLLRFQQ
ncbi:hypothetical protein D3C87_1309250 [compost metagenome]